MLISNLNLSKRKLNKVQLSSSMYPQMIKLQTFSPIICAKINLSILEGSQVFCSFLVLIRYTSVCIGPNLLHICIFLDSFLKASSQRQPSALQRYLVWSFVIISKGEEIFGWFLLLEMLRIIERGGRGVWGESVTQGP